MAQKHYKVLEPGKSDQELVALTLQDKNNYRAIVEKYKFPLLTYVQRISRLQKEDAKDITQEAFLKAYRHLNDYDPDLKFSSWLYRITHNETITYLRKLKTRPQTVDFETNQVFIEGLEADLDLEKELDRKFIKEKVKSLLDQINDKYRHILVLKYMEEKNYEEISDILQKPIGSVASLLNRAKTNLRAEIQKNKKPLT